MAYQDIRDPKRAEGGGLVAQGEALEREHPPRSTVTDEYGPTGEFQVKDSGERVEFGTGMVRDTDKGKPRFDLIDRPMLTRLAVHLAKGAEKYGDNNWRHARTEEELHRFEASAFRHLVQWMEGERDEDHAAAVMFNVIAGEYVRSRLEHH